jgi:tetratricopeptide (TPR) repeat protein
MAKTAVRTNPPPARRFESLWISLALAAVTLVVFWPVTHFQFVTYDDPDFVLSNPYVQAGLTAQSFIWAWHSEVARNWHPITMMTHMLDCQFYAMNAGRHHLTNLLIHIANSVLLFHLLKLMTRLTWRSAFIAGLFALHPLHVESVAWIAERKDVLSTLFWFASIWAYVQYTKGKKIFYAVALVLFALGLMSKPMLVTGPFLLLLLDFWPLGRAKPFRMKLLWEKAPFLLLSIADCVVTYLIQLHGGAVRTVTTLSLGARVANALISYLRYIEKMFWPRNLAALYLRMGDWPIWLVLIAAAVLAVVSILAIKQRSRRPWLAVGWFWYLGTLVPVIGLVQVGMQSMADRFTYVPLIGIFIILTWGVTELAQQWAFPKFASPAASGAVLVICAGLTAHQVQYWKDSEALFGRMIAVSKNNYMAHYNLGNFYLREHQADRAEAEYKAALEQEPNYAEAHNNFGNLLLEQKQYEAALDHYQTAIRLNAQPVYYLNYANTLADMASAHHDTNAFAAAVRAYGQAIAVDPNSSEAHCNLGMTWAAQGRDAEAAAEFREAIRLKPDYETAQMNLGNSASRLGRMDEAAAAYAAAERLNPNDPEIHNDLAMCYAMQNKLSEAAREFVEVIRFQPDNGGAEGNLGNALASQNKIDEAIPHYLAALRLNPKDFQSEFNLGLTLARAGRKDEAALHYQQALRINPNYVEARRALVELQQAAPVQK